MFKLTRSNDVRNERYYQRNRNVSLRRRMKQRNLTIESMRFTSPRSIIVTTSVHLHLVFRVTANARIAVTAV